MRKNKIVLPWEKVDHLFKEKGFNNNVNQIIDPVKEQFYGVYFEVNKEWYNKNKNNGK